jgi:hypothetical protein
MEGEGNFFTRKVGGMPAWVWLAGAAVLVYFLMSRQSSAANRPTTSGGGGTITTGPTRVAKDAVKVTVFAGRRGDGDEETTDNDQPGHKPESFKKLRVITVPKNETLGEFAASRNWSEATIDDLGQFEQPKGTTFAGKKLSSLGMRLKKGDKIARPADKDTGG